MRDSDDDVSEIFRTCFNNIGLGLQSDLSLWHADFNDAVDLALRNLQIGY